MSSILRILPAIFVIGLSLIATTSAAPVLELSPSSGRAGDTVTAFGSSFNVAGIEFAQATMRFNGIVVKEYISISGHPNGGFTASFTVPSGTPPGTYMVQATGPLDSAETTFTVTAEGAAPIIEQLIPSGIAAEMVTAIGSLENMSGTQLVQPTTAFASAAPVLELSPSSGRAGDTVTAFGSSFNVAGIEFAQATMRFNGIVVKEYISISGYPNGGFTASFTVPSGTPPGTYMVQATGPLDSAEATFTVTKSDEINLHGMSISDGKLPDSGHSWAGYKKACEDDTFDLSFNLDSIVGGLNANINMAQNKRYGIGFINLNNGSISVYLFKEYGDQTGDLLQEALLPLNIAVERIYLAAEMMNPAIETGLRVRIAYDRGHIEVYVSRADQEIARPVIDYYDEDPLPPGNLDFETLEGSSANLSEVVTSCSSQTEESGNLGIFYAKEPDVSYLINATSDSPFYVRWGEVPANQFLVMISDTISFEEAREIARQLAAKLGETTNQEVNVVGEFEYTNLFQIETQSRVLAELVRDISFAGTFSPLVVDVFPNQQIYAEDSLSQNPFYQNETTGKGYQIIGVQGAWNEIAGSGIKLSKVNVGIVDDGIYLKDGQFSNVDVDTSLKIYPEPPSCKLSSPLCGMLSYAGSHGTGVANLLASDTKGKGLQGIASCLPEGMLKIFMINITGKKGKSFVTSSMLAFQCEIQNGSGIISCSMGSTGDVHPGAPRMYERFFSDLSKDPKFDDVLFIFSAGNEGKQIDGKNRIPNGIPKNRTLPNVITVGNVMNDKTKANGQWVGSGPYKWQASRSNNNSKNNEYYVTMAAPGEQALWGGNAGRGFINRLGGTSMAAPQVTAAAILIRSIDPCLTAGQIKDRLIETSSPGPTDLGGRILSINNSIAETISHRTIGTCRPFGPGESIDLPNDYNNYHDIYGYTDIAEDIEIRSAVYSDSNRKILYCQKDNILMVYNRIYLAGSDLGDVKKVTYHLHESFQNPVQVSTNPINGFEIWIMAWGSFMLRAEIETKDGQVIERDYNLSYRSKLVEATGLGIPMEQVPCDDDLNSLPVEAEIVPQSTVEMQPLGFDTTINIVSGQYKGYTVSVDGQQIGVEGQGEDVLDGNYAFTVEGNQQHLIRVDHPMNWKWWQYFYNAGDSVTYDF